MDSCPATLFQYRSICFIMVIMHKCFTPSLPVFIFFALLLNAQHAMGQWNPDPAVNTPVCTTPVVNQYFPQLVPDGTGGLYIAWLETTDGNTSQIYAQHLSADGNRLWAVGGIPVTSAIGLYTQPQIASDGNGGAIISWIDLAGTVIHHYMQRMSPGGQRLWNANGVAVCPAQNTQTLYYQLLSDGMGGAILVWDDLRSGSNEVFAQRVGGTGTLQWPAAGIAVSPPFTNLASYEAVPDSTGGLMLCFTLTTGVATRNDVFVQHINGQGLAQWGAQGINICAAAKDQLYCKIVKDTGHNIIVVWQDFRFDPVKSQLYGQRIAPTGTRLWAEGGVLLADSVVAASTGFKIASDTKGGVQLAWLDNFILLSSTTAHLFSLQVDSMGNTPNVKKEIATWEDLQMPVDFKHVPDFKGGSLLCWIRPAPATPTGNQFEIFDIYYQHLLANGNAAFSTTGQPVSSAPMSQFYQQIIADSAGNAFAAWSDVRSATNLDLYATKLALQAALPVSWISFSGRAVEHRVFLEWKTADEINNQGFIVQHSADGIVFNDMGFTPATNNAGQSTYRFTDQHPVPGVNFYRLNQIDKDGRTSYSGIVKVNIAQQTEVLLYPNPAYNQLSLQGNITGAIITIYSQDGRKIKELQNDNSATVTIGVRELVPGHYTLTLTNPVTKKLRSMAFIKK